MLSVLGIALLAMVSAGSEPETSQETPISAAELSPLPAGIEFRRVNFTSAGDATVAGAATAGADEKLAYSSVLGSFVVPLPANTRIADDLTLAVSPGCRIRRIEFPVFGKVNPTGVGGRFTLTTELFSNCPNSVPQTTTELNRIRIPESRSVLTFDDDSPRIVSIEYPNGLELPPGATSVWWAFQFNRANTGLLAGAPASKGLSCDLFDFPGSSCFSYFGGFPSHPFANFNIDVYADAGCADGFPGYRANRPSQATINPGAGLTLLDDIELNTNVCRMSSYEVAVKGFTGYEFELRTECDGAPIEGAESFLVPPAGIQPSASFLHRVVFDPPILIPKNLFFAARVGNSTGGVVLSGQFPCGGGKTEDYFSVITESGGCAPFFAPSVNQHEALNVTITCAGEAPIGACCDMYFVGEEGDAVCRQVPKFNCPFPWISDFYQPQWVESGSCDADPFPHPCGAAACCRPDYGCENLTKAECDAVEPLDRPRQWQRGLYCGFDGQSCPYIDCLARVGDCNVAHDAGGCANSSCCSEVCDLDDYCCRVEWDRVCVDLAVSLCDPNIEHDHCWSTFPSHGALEIAASGSTYFSNRGATASPTDPPFTCLNKVPGSGTTWFKFTAAAESATIDLNHSGPDGDSIIQVFSVGDPTSDETSCNSLQPIACGDDVRGCVQNSRHPRFCVNGLVPGSVYYLMFAGQSSADSTYRLDLFSPCTAGTTDCDGDGIEDQCERDCDHNSRPDECDTLAGFVSDCDHNLIPDSCDPDCNANGLPDACDITSGYSDDCDGDLKPDDCSLNFARIILDNAGSSFGNTVALEGDLAAIGDIGAVHVLRREGSTWVNDSELTPSSGFPDPESGFGSFVSISGDWILVGAPYDSNTNDSPNGAIYFFRRQITGWELYQRIPTLIERGYRLFGLAGDMDGDFAAVSAISPSGDDEHVVYVYRWDGREWYESQTLHDPSPDSKSLFGTSLAISGDWIAVGTPFNIYSYPLTGDGTVELFARDGGEWNHNQTLTGPAGQNLVRFGEGVSMDGEVLAVHTRTGSESRTIAAVYQQTNSNWEFDGLLTPNPPRPFYGLGADVSVRNGRVAVTPIYPLPDEAIAFLFDQTETGWKDTQRWYDQGRPYLQTIRPIVALGDDNLMVGLHPWDDYVNDQQGVGPIFSLPLEPIDCNGNRIPDACEDNVCRGEGLTENHSIELCQTNTQALLPDSPNESFGSSMDVDGDLMVVADEAEIPGAGGLSPSVYVHRRQDGEWVREARLVSPDPSHEILGWSAAVANGQVYAVAVGVADAPDFTRGAVLGFRRVGSEWVNNFILQIDDPEVTFERSVCLVSAGSATLVVGTCHAGGGVGQPEPVVLYVYDINNDQPVFQAKLTNPLEKGGRTFGYSFTIDEDRIVVGAPEDRTVFVYERVDERWILSSRIPSDGPETPLEFGKSVSLHGRLLAVGTGENTPSAWMYRESNGHWRYDGTFVAVGAIWSNSGGSVVLLDAGHVAVEGEYGVDGATLAVLGQRKSDGTWGQFDVVRSQRVRFPGYGSTSITGQGSELFIGEFAGQFSDDTRDASVSVFRVKPGDCNGNAVDDSCDLLSGSSVDCNGNRIPDECDWRGRFDADFDGDTDLRDAASMLACFSGEGAGIQSACCRVFDAGRDGKIDTNDWASIGIALTGPGG